MTHRSPILLFAALAASLCLPGAACSREAEPGSDVAAVATNNPQSATDEQADTSGEEDRPLPVYGYRIVETYPHDPGAFTQGLFWRDGHLYEGTGRHNQSTIRRVALESGAVLDSEDIPGTYFGEGIVDWDDTIIGLTWRQETAFVYDRETLERIGQFSYEGEGWGLTRNDEHLIMSDGSDTLRFLDPETFDPVRRLAVTLDGQPLTRLNELEWIDGEIFANVWQTDAIARIDPETGRVTGIINLSGLSREAGIGPSRDLVLNGIAWDADNDRLFVTGKYWPSLFEIELTPPSP